MGARSWFMALASISSRATGMIRSRGPKKMLSQQEAIKKDQVIPVKCSSMEKIIIKGKARAVGLTAFE